MTYIGISNFWFSGIVSTCVGHPMDTVRVIQQVTNTKTIKATRLVYEQNGVSENIDYDFFN